MSFAFLPGQCLKDVIDAMLRVDHAGETSAVSIYKGQQCVLPLGDPYRIKIEEMGKQEEEHLRQCEDLMRQHGVRPSALLPLWQALGFSLGALTALLGRKSAMACTIGVEETIETHYQKQIAWLKRVCGDDASELIAQLNTFLADEVAHKEQAQAYKGAQAPFFPLLKTCVQWGCRTAIQIAERW